MTAPGPAQPTSGAPESPASGAPAAPTQPGSGSQVNPPFAPQQQPAPQQPAPAQPTPQQPAALPSGQPPAALPVPAAQAPAPVAATQTPAAAAPAPAAPAPAAAPPAAAPAKAGPPKSTKKAKPASGGGGGYLVAVFALIIAVIAAGAAAYSLKISMDLRDGNTQAPLAEAPIPDASTPTEAPPTAEPTPTPTEDEPAGPEYVAELVRVALEVPNPTGCTAAYVDVDTGSIGVQNGHEFYLSRCQNPSTLRVHVDRTSGRSTSGDDPSAEECGALVAGTPTTELVLEAEEELTFCLITNRAQATAANLPQRLAIVEVLSVTTAEVRLALSTFRIED